MTGDDRIPVIVATGQSVERDEPVSAVDLAERAARIAIDAAPRLTIDRVSFVGIVGPGPYNAAPATALARRLGIADRAACEVTTIGGNSPQWLVGRAAADIANGMAGTVLVAGGEAMMSKKPAPPGPDGVPREPDPVVGDDRFGVGPAESAIGLVLPAHIYPMMESVLAARAGRTNAEHRAALGRLMAPFTEQAAKHPCAWVPQVLTAEEIATPSPDNRIVAEPYTKRMNAFLNVNQGAALVVTSLAAARAAGVADGAVFIRSAAAANDVWHPSARPDLGASAGMAAAINAALHAADVDALDHLDLYSCFPVAVELAAAVLGVTHDNLTVTGGLPYFGGPGNNYVTHAIATMVERIRTDGGSGLVTAIGWYLNKHAAGVYSAEPPPSGFAHGATDQAAIDATALPVSMGANGPATVDAATVVYGRDGSVTAAPVIATTADGVRVVAAAAPEELEELAGVNLVGATVHVDGAYRVKEAP